MAVEIATGKNMKKVKVFLGKDGQVYEGSIYEAISGANNPRPAGANRVPTEPAKTEEAK